MAVTRVRYTYHRPGKPSAIYDEWLVLDRPDVKVLLQDQYRGPGLLAGDERIQESGAPMVWFVFPERWYDIARFHLLDGTFTGWYTNLTTPVRISGDSWSATDLFLDLWTPMTGGSMWLDETDLETATRAGTIDRVTRQRIDNERALIELQLKLGAWPPPITRDIDLAQALRLRGA